MNLLERTIQHITEVARIPSFSSFEERLHPYIHQLFEDIPKAYQVEADGNNIIYTLPGSVDGTVALTAHLDKINHFGVDHLEELPVISTDQYIEGAMDDSTGVGILLALAEFAAGRPMPDLLFFFSEMEESKGLKEHPELLKNNGVGYESGMGAKHIAKQCLDKNIIPDEVITIDTTPLFKGESGIALYSRHWELNELEASPELVKQTNQLEQNLLAIDDSIKIDNNTNDYLHYGFEFNISGNQIIPSVALEPSIYPYHQKGERVFIDDIRDVLHILRTYLESKAS